MLSRNLLESANASLGRSTVFDALYVTVVFVWLETLDRVRESRTAIPTLPWAARMKDQNRKKPSTFPA
jgi:hypothetical protein